MNRDDYAALLDRLADEHRDRLVRALQALEERVASLAAEAPTEEGRLYDLEYALNARQQLRQHLESEFLTEVQSIIEEYEEVAAQNLVMLNTYGDFTGLDPAVIAQLQRQTFQGFNDLSDNVLDTLASGMYQNTLTGRSRGSLIKEMRQVINGVYIQSDEAEIQQLVEVANFGSPEESERAIALLHSKYAADKTGQNMRRYATQQVQDSIMQFNASITVATGKENGVDRWEYFGDVILDTRPFCQKHVNEVMTTEQIEKLWESEDWKGKAAGDPFVVRGGYNCRHHWLPVKRKTNSKEVR